MMLARNMMSSNAYIPIYFVSFFLVFFLYNTNELFKWSVIVFVSN